MIFRNTSVRVSLHTFTLTHTHTLNRLIMHKIKHKHTYRHTLAKILLLIVDFGVCTVHNMLFISPAKRPYHTVTLNQVVGLIMCMRYKTYVAWNITRNPSAGMCGTSSSRTAPKIKRKKVPVSCTYNMNICGYRE
jgi:hypothetical protein